ncbi:MAG: Rpn family recombination-promoting nuclease/putative transposase [Alkalinema sp. RU_4_3]|nr:Rpn family recombination-promoting nuclease/putative transposase [Alkalinema sp. RU_4_3]
METDSLFYRLFKEKPKLVFELLGEKPPRTAYTFGSHEIKQTSLRADGILQPKSTKSPIVFVEAQGYLDRENKVYPSFFAKIFMYLRDETPVNDWRAVMVFTQRKYDLGLPIHYHDFLVTQRLQLIYLDELDQVADQSLEISLVQLIGLNQRSAFDRAKTILDQTQQQTSDAIEQQRVLEWIVTVFVHKFPKLSREEIRTMLGTKAELKKTRFYQEMREETTEEVKQELLLEVVPICLQAGLSVAEIAKRFKVPIKQVREIIKNSGLEG